MSENEQNILHPFVDARELIRRKYILKRNKEFVEKTVGETFKPLVDPLDKLITLSEKPIKNLRVDVMTQCRNQTRSKHSAYCEGTRAATAMYM